MKSLARNLAATFGLAVLITSANAETAYIEDSEASVSLPTRRAEADDAAVLVDGPIARSGTNYLSIVAKTANGAPLMVDDFSVIPDAIPEPSAALLGGIGALLLLRRRK